MKYTVTPMDENHKAIEYYYKMHKCLRKAMTDPKLGCHVNNIIVHLGKSIESQYKYYDEQHDAWCDYFLRVNRNGSARLTSTGEIVKIHFWHKDGIAYVTPSGIRLANHGEYEEIENN